MGRAERGPPASGGAVRWRIGAIGLELLEVGPVGVVRLRIGGVGAARLPVVATSGLAGVFFKVAGLVPLAAVVAASGFVAVFFDVAGLVPLAAVAVASGFVAVFFDVAGLVPLATGVAIAGSVAFFLARADLRGGSESACARLAARAAVLRDLDSSRRISICRLGSSV